MFEMKASQIEVGKTHTIKHHAGRTYPVQVKSLDYALLIGARRNASRYRCTKLATVRSRFEEGK
jgi:hypothetical protein